MRIDKSYILRKPFMNGERVQAIIIQNRSVIFGYGCIDKTKKEFRHFFIGGRIEEGETPEDAIIREIKEETNLKANIVFRFAKEIYANHITFLTNIGDKKPASGFDPEEVDINKELRALQELQFVSLYNRDGFTDIDIEYFRLLTNECNEWAEDIFLHPFSMSLDPNFGSSFFYYRPLKVWV